MLRSASVCGFQMCTVTYGASTWMVVNNTSPVIGHTRGCPPPKPYSSTLSVIEQGSCVVHRGGPIVSSVCASMAVGVLCPSPHATRYSPWFVSEVLHAPCAAPADSGVGRVISMPMASSALPGNT